jgi:hypothetical protein
VRAPREVELSQDAVDVPPAVVRQQPARVGRALTPADEDELRRAPGLARRWWLVGGASVIASIAVIGVLVSRSSASGDDTAPAPPSAAATERASVATTAPEPVRGATPPPASPPQPAVAPPATPPPPDDGVPVIGAGPCKLDITTTPAGTMVALDGRTVGPSPISLAGTCDSHKLEFVHPRYKTEERVVALAADKPTTLDVSLVRPTHALSVVTNPPGANVYIAGRPAGASPTIVQVMGFTGMDVKVERLGYTPVTTHVYSKVANDTLVVNLRRVGQPQPSGQTRK